MTLLSKEFGKKILEIEEKSRRNCEYLIRNFKKIEENYGGKVVIIVDENVIASCSLSEFSKVYPELLKKYGEDKLRGDCVIYIPKPGEVLML